MKRKGFTLIEVALSMAIFSIVIVGVASLVFASRENRRRSEVSFELENYCKVIEEQTRRYHTDDGGRYYVYFNDMDQDDGDPTTTSDEDGIPYILDNFVTEKADTVNKYVVTLNPAATISRDNCKSLNTFERKYGAYIEFTNDPDTNLDTITVKVWDLSNPYNKYVEANKKFMVCR